MEEILFLNMQKALIVKCNSMKLLLTIILLGIFTACSFKKHETSSAQRPASIPESAFWIGGPDGGNWYFIHSVHDHRNSAIISVYGEGGDLIVKRNFIVVCRLDKPIVWIDDLKSQIVGYDGNKVLLLAPAGKDVCWMQ